MENLAVNLCISGDFPGHSTRGRRSERRVRRELQILIRRKKDVWKEGDFVLNHLFA